MPVVSLTARMWVRSLIDPRNYRVAATDGQGRFADFGRRGCVVASDHRGHVTAALESNCTRLNMARAQEIPIYHRRLRVTWLPEEVPGEQADSLASRYGLALVPRAAS